MRPAAAAAKPSIGVIVHDGAGCLTKYLGEHAIVWIGGGCLVVEGFTAGQQSCAFMLRTVAHPGKVVARTQVHQQDSVWTDRLVESGYNALRARLDLANSAH